MQHFNILIVGAGIAGLTFANLIKRRGANFKIIEKEKKDAFNTSGYMLGILPLGGRVMTELDLKDEYFNQSIEMSNYEIHQENGKLIKAFSLDFINRQYGSYRGIERKELIKILSGNIDEESITFGTTVLEIQQGSNWVDITFSDRKKERFDLVVLADGIYSATRKALWNNQEYNYYDTDWGGWVDWLENKNVTAYKEYWGASSFMGLYPVENRIGIFVGGPNKLLKELGPIDLTRSIKEAILPEFEIPHSALDALIASKDPFYWELKDCRTNKWKKGNVLLLGDAACGFLPTAGVGASMAMDSASALADELSRTDKEHLGYGINLYIKRQKDRVEKAQDDSRRLGKLMFVDSNFVAGLRDYAIRFYSINNMANNISKIMEG